MFNRLPEKLIAPHIPLRLPIDDALDILRSYGGIKKEEDHGLESYELYYENVRVSVYERNGFVWAVGYSDPIGRRKIFGKKKKIKMYLERYGRPEDWGKGDGDAWTAKYFNHSEQIILAYVPSTDYLKFMTNDG